MEYENVYHVPAKEDSDSDSFSSDFPLNFILISV